MKELHPSDTCRPVSKEACVVAVDASARSWAKSLTWRVVGVFILGGISYAATRDWGKTTAITLIFHVIRTLLYYVHERLWERVRWGRSQHPLAHLVLRDDLTAEDLHAIEELLSRERYTAERPEYEI